MCGIAGILRTDGQAIPEIWLDLMLDRVAHRGPDGRGRLRDRATLASGRTAEIALVHARLAIIDPACGQQPMVWAETGIKASRLQGIERVPLVPGSAGGLASVHERSTDGRLAVVFNGCIYNHRGLRRELQSRGVAFATDHSDTEVLLHGHRAWRGRLPQRLEGMFAYALWDCAAATLTLARDRTGEKPLYYWVGALDGAPLALFASAVPAILAVLRAAFGPVFPPLDTDAWQHPLLYGYTVGPTPHLGVAEVMPGTVLTIDTNRAGASAVEGHRYWKPPERAAVGRSSRPSDGRDDRPIATASPSLTADRVDALLRDAVVSRLESDVPLGCFLSGGIDSPLVAHYARAHLGTLATFTVRMPDPRYDESDAAAAVAKHLGTTHRTLDVEARPAEDLVALVAQLGLPFADSSILPTYWVSKAARRHVKVALSGDGGDELFLGYERYRATRWLARWGTALTLWPLLATAGRGDPKSRGSKLARLIEAARHGGYPDLVRTFPTRDARRLGIDERLIHRDSFRSLDLAIMHDFQRYLPGDLLRKTDTASMAVALEVRCPFLDTRLMEAALVAPAKALMPRGQRKGLLKAVARRYLPAALVERPKMGFAIPIGEWFRTDFGGMHALLMDQLNSIEPFGPFPLERARVEPFLREHMDGRADHGQRLFALLTLSLWTQRFAV